MRYANYEAECDAYPTYGDLAAEECYESRRARRRFTPCQEHCLKFFRQNPNAHATAGELDEMLAGWDIDYGAEKVHASLSTLEVDGFLIDMDDGKGFRLIPEAAEGLDAVEWRDEKRPLGVQPKRPGRHTNGKQVCL